VAGISLYAPWNLPIGVRAALIITISWSFTGEPFQPMGLICVPVGAA
jgi:hypothetical protein